MLLDPFEEQFNMPATPIQFGNGNGRKGEIVCDEGKCLVSFLISVLYASKRFREIHDTVLAREFNRLVADKSG